MSFALLLTIGGLTATGLYLITARSLSRIILGFSLLGHAAVLSLLIAGGAPGSAPIAGTTDDMANPVPQALALTAIVISFGLTLFLLALAGRQQLLTGDDLVEDDLEDSRIASGLDIEDTAMSALVAATILAPLFCAAAGLGVRANSAMRDAITVVGLVTAAASAIALLVQVADSGTHVVRVGDWGPELGIVLVADLFATLVMPVALSIIVVVEMFAIGQRRTAWGANPELAGPLLCVLTSGVSLAFLTGDLFTLFVAFEMILVSSYVLLTHQGQRDQIRSGMTYVVMNLLASTLFLIGLALVYASTGTVNIALASERIAELPDGVRLGIGAWFLVVFGTKAAIFPLFSWLPDSYPTAPTTITAVFAGLLTKVGIYAMIRFHNLAGMDELGPIMLVLAAVTMIVGALGALAQSDVKRILSFHIVSQIGYMLMGLGLFTEVGTTAAILFLVHHMPVKTVLFLVGGLIENEQGTSALAYTGGLASRRPLIAAFFAVPALSLAGMPPFSGFVAKFAVIGAGMAEASSVAVLIAVVAALVAGALTLLSMTKIWLGVFWGEQASVSTGQGSVETVGNRRAMVAATGLAVLGTLAISFFAGTLFDLSQRAAADLHNPATYVEAVES